MISTDYQQFLTQKQVTAPPAGRITLTCAECDTTFRRYPSQITGEKQYCSLACVGKAKRHGSELFCAMCDTAFYRRYGEQDARQHFCSPACYADWRALHSSPDTYLKTGQRHTHRVVAEQVLGRALLPDEVVHHKDENKHNNDPSNLAIFPNQTYHARCHFGAMSDAELSSFSLV